jgi:hypothetical protein
MPSIALAGIGRQPVMTYLLGLAIIPQMLVRRERWPGGRTRNVVPLVYPGQDVQPDQPIIRLGKQAEIDPGSRLQGPSQPRIEDESIPIQQGTMKGNTAQQDEVLAAGLRGRVVDITRRGGVVIESRAALIQGTLGIGNQVVGILTLWSPSEAIARSHAIPAGAILVIPGPLNFAILQQAQVSGVVGIIAASVALRDLEGFARSDMVKLLTDIDAEERQAHLAPMTILLTEGIGAAAMPAPTLNLLTRYQDSIALLSGITSNALGLYPELVISLPTNEVQMQWNPEQPDPTVALGVQVRVCSGEFEGATGTVVYMFSHEQVFTSGIHARAARLRLENGKMIVEPLANIERLK